MSRIFISYRRQDSEGYVGRLYDNLALYFDSGDLFMDVDNIPPGADFVSLLEEAVAACDTVIAVIGPAWLALTDGSGARRLDQPDDFVRIEIASALKQGKLVIPALVGGAAMPRPEDLPEDLRPLARRNAVELSHLRFKHDVEILAKAISEASPARKPRADSATLRQKEAALKALRAELVSAENSPLYHFRVQNGYFPVIGEGSADARILFIGEAPGKQEAENGRPFIGPSGEVLDEMLHSVGLRREDVFVTNILLDRPPDQHDPTPAELAFYTPYVDRIIAIIQPAVIVSLGGYAMTYLLRKFDLPEKRGKISDLHGKLLKARASYGEIHLLPLFHPAVVLYTASKKDVLRKDFQKLKLFI